jgi:polyisoprenoid-binding protein YceI
MFRLIFLFFLLLTLRTGAQTLFTVKEGEVSFFSEAPLENIEAHNRSVQALLNTKTRELAFRIPIRKFKFQKSLMEEHFNEKYMESDDFPMATFKGTIKEPVDLSGNGDHKVTAVGKMTIHGVEREVSAPGTVTVKDGEINVQSDFSVMLKDYKITIPQVVFQNIAENIAIKVRIKFIPYTK